MDAIESGIVKVPRMPVDDDADRRPGHLPAALGPRRHAAAEEASCEGRTEPLHDWVIPTELEGALQSLYRSYEQVLRALGADARAARRAAAGDASSSAPTPSSPSWSTTGSPGYDVDAATAARASPSPASSSCFSNVVDGRLLARPRTILVDSAQLESGEAMKADFKQAAARGDRGVQGRATGGATRARTPTSSPTRTSCAR